MSITLPLPEKLSYTIGKQTKSRILMSQFGDGYSQRAPDGLNARVDTWTIAWIPLNASDRSIVINALNAAGSFDAITWIPYGETALKKFIVTTDGYTLRFEGGYTHITCNLIQVFDL
jgi:phage-related protein